MYWYKLAVMDKRSEHLVITQIPMSWKKQKCAASSKGENKALASIDFRLYFHGDLLEQQCSFK